MLKIRNLIFALSLSPVLSVIWQLPNQAQVSKSTAGTDSGAATGGSQTSIFSLPSTGTSIVIPVIPGVPTNVTNGISTTGNLTQVDTTVPVTGTNIESTSSSITVTDSPGGDTVVLTASQQLQVILSQLATAIIQGLSNAPGGSTSALAFLLTGGSASDPAAASLTSRLTTAGISQQQSQRLVNALKGLFASPQASLPNLPVAQAASGQLVASNKILKPISVIAQADVAPTVNINQLNDAIISYNGIILQSEPDALKKLAQDQDFVAIGKILKELSNSIP